MRIEKFTNLYRDVTKEGTKIPQEKYCLAGQFPIVDQGQRVIAGWWNDDDGIFKDVPAIIFGDHTRAIKYMEEPFFIGADGVKILRPTNVNDNPKYLYYALQSAKIPNLGYSRHFKVVKELEIRMYSRDEQDEIVRVLEKIDYLIEQRHVETTYIDQLVKSRFIELFGDPLSNDKGWKKVVIAEVCHAIFGGGTPSKSHPEYFAGSIPWVSPKDMKSSVINDSIDHITEEAIAHSTTNLVPANSVLMVIRSGILKHSLPVSINSLPVTINQDMKAFVPNETVKTAFLMHFFKAIENDVLAGVRGVTADNIDFKAFQKRTIIVPPLALQEQFAAFVEQTDKSKYYKSIQILKIITEAIAKEVSHDRIR